MDDSRKAMEADARLLTYAAQVIRNRFTTGKHDELADRVRQAGVELLSRARHPSRARQP